MRCPNCERKIAFVRSKTKDAVCTACGTNTPLETIKREKKLSVDLSKDMKDTIGGVKERE